MLDFSYSGEVYSTFLIDYDNFAESIYDRDNLSNLSMSIDENKFCGLAGRMITTYWEYSGYAYNRFNPLDSIIIEDVIVEIKNGN